MPSDDASQGQDCILPDDVFRSERRAHVDAVALSQTSDLECAGHAARPDLELGRDDSLDLRYHHACIVHHLIYMIVHIQKSNTEFC